METIDLLIIFELMTINTNKVYAVTHFILIANTSYTLSGGACCSA